MFEFIVSELFHSSDTKVKSRGHEGHYTEYMFTDRRFLSLCTHVSITSLQIHCFLKENNSLWTTFLVDVPISFDPFTPEIFTFYKQTWT